MEYEQKLNAISRLVLLLTMLGFLLTQSFTFLLMGAATLGVIFWMYKRDAPNKTQEGFKDVIFEVTKNNAFLKNPETLEEFVKKDYEITNAKNPFQNVLLPQINEDPDRKSAPPSFHPEIAEDITHSVKEMVQELNPDIKDTNKQLFGDLGENFYLDQSNRQFFSTANTKVANDQGAFGQFLYGTMYSAKESGVEGAIARVQDNYRYTLY
jgi:hypothetical protein